MGRDKLYKAYAKEVGELERQNRKLADLERRYGKVTIYHEFGKYWMIKGAKRNRWYLISPTGKLIKSWANKHHGVWAEACDLVPRKFLG